MFEKLVFEGRSKLSDFDVVVNALFLRLFTIFHYLSLLLELGTWGHWFLLLGGSVWVREGWNALRGSYTATLF